MEAADDICYTIIDFEDGINLGLIQEEFALEYLIKLVKETINTKKYHQLKNTQDRISYLRALAINTLINEVVRIFMNNEEAILKGEFQTALLDKSKYEAQINDIIKISVENIYRSDEVIDKEIAGYEILKSLLSVYTNAVNNNYNGIPSNYDRLILNRLPKTMKVDQDSLYLRLLSVCNYVSLLSDSNAILNYKKIKGTHI